MRYLLAFFAVSGLCLVAVRAQGTEKACDIKTVIPAFYCESCDAVLEKKDLVSDKTAFACKSCDTLSLTAGECDGCGDPLAKTKSGKDVCKSCLQKPIAAEACKKVFFVCPDCSDEASAPGECPDCEVTLKEQVSLALIQYECPECGDSGYKAGKCEDEECKLFGKPLKRLCSESGTYPHVPTKQ